MRLGLFQRRRRVTGNVVDTTSWQSKASYYSVADAGNLTLSGNDVTGWPNLITGGPDPGFSEGTPASYTQYATTNFGGKGEISYASGFPLYFSDNEFGSLSGIWACVVCRLATAMATSNRIIIGGGSQLALALSSGDMAVFDGAYKGITGASITTDTDMVLIWKVAGESSFEGFINGVSQGTATLDGSLGSDNLGITIGGYNKNRTTTGSIRALAFGFAALDAAELDSLIAWGDEQL